MVAVHHNMKRPNPLVFAECNTIAFNAGKRSFPLSALRGGIRVADVEKSKYSCSDLYKDMIRIKSFRAFLLNFCLVFIIEHFKKLFEMVGNYEKYEHEYLFRNLITYFEI